MSDLVRGITPEPQFPRTDISGDNAYALAVLLRRPVELEAFHRMAEASMRRYSLGHSALHGTAVTVMDGNRARSMGVGIAIYEAMATLLKPKASDIDENGLLVIEAVPTKDNDDFLSYLDYANDDFKAKLPTAVDVVKDAAQCIIDNEFYAIVGAAAARQLELDTISN